MRRRVPLVRHCALPLLACLVACGSVPPTPGTPGLGDDYFPLQGNGGYDVAHYDLALSVDPAAGTLQGVATLEARATQGLSSFHLDLHGLEVTSVRVDDVEAAFAREGDELVVTPVDAVTDGAHFVVRVAYGGTPQAVPSPAVPFVPGVGWMTTDDSVYVMGEPNGAPSWFPCNDHPSDKATYTFALTVPKPLVAVANGEPVSLTDAGDELRTYVFEASDPMASYLATIAVGPFDVSEVELPSGLVVRGWYHPDVSAEQRAPFDAIPPMIAYFSHAFGGYPFETFGSIASDLPIGAALETQTVPTYGLRSVSESTIAHELAHQWFGNSVSVETFADIWLAEGFASYASWLWLEHTKGREALEKHVERMYGILVRTEADAPADPGVGEMFGVGVYVRGAWALHALRLAVGDETFFEILQTWAGRFRHANANVSDFEALAAEISGEVARETLTPWLHHVALPVVTFDVTQSADDQG